MFPSNIIPMSLMAVGPLDSLVFCSQLSAVWAASPTPKPHNAVASPGTVLQLCLAKKARRSESSSRALGEEGLSERHPQKGSPKAAQDHYLPSPWSCDDETALPAIWHIVSLFHRPAGHRRGLSEYFNGVLLLPLRIKIRKYATYANLLSKLLLSPEHIRDHKSQVCIIMNCTLFSRNMCSLLTEACILHHFTGVRPLKVLSLKVKKFKYFVVSSPRGVGRHHTLCKTFFQRYPRKTEPLCGIYGILNDGYNVGLSAVKKFPDFILCA